MKKTIILLFLGVFAITSFAFKGTRPPKKNVGIQLYSLRDDMSKDPRKTIIDLGKIGYAFVETYGYKDGTFYGMTPKDFKLLVQENDMKVLGAHCGQDLPETTQWDNTMQWWDKCIAACKEAGVKYIVQPSMGKVGYESLNGLKKYCDYFNIVGDKCQRAGILFGYHNHTEEFGTLEGKIIYEYMLENTDPNKVFFQMDLWWVTTANAKYNDYFNKYPGRFKSWHLKDEKEIGTSGKMNFKDIYTYSKVAGLKFAVVEQEDYSTTPLESVKASFNFIKKQKYIPAGN